MEIQSYGGGIQSSALLILNARGDITPRATHALFADTGSELEATYDHIEKFAKPFCRDHDIEFVTVDNPTYGRLHEYQLENDHLMIPMYGSAGGILNRQCTHKFKILPIRRWLRSIGVKNAVVQLGISWDEVHRVKDSGLKWAVNRYPLVDLRLNRAACAYILEMEGVPLPVKSACFICPYRRMSGWVSLRERSPAEFEAAVEFEAHFEGEFLTKQGQRIDQGLDQVVGNQPSLFEDEECGGYCWT